MKSLYEKKELIFSLVWIGIYIVLFSTADSISANIGIEGAVTAPLAIFISLVLILWIKKNELLNKYGLYQIKGRASQYLFFIPLILISTVNFWFGFDVGYSNIEIVLLVISMFFVGVIEEIIFRGFLFKALSRKNIMTAIIISSVTFGVGHIVNLLNGADFMMTLFQLCYAIAIGFIFTIVFYRTGSLIPCIISHSIINVTSVFSADGTKEMNEIIAIGIVILSVIYALILLKQNGKKENIHKEEYL